MSIFSIFRAIKQSSCWRMSGFGLFFLLSVGIRNSTAQAEVQVAPVKQHLIPVDYVPESFGQTLLGQPLVTVMLNETTSATFFVDTGSAPCIISQSLAKKLNLPLAPAVDSAGRPVTLKYGEKQATMGRVSRISIGKFIFNDQAMVVADEKAFMLRPGIPYDGVLGMKILRFTGMILDTQRHTITFCYPGRVEPATLAKLGFTNPYVLPLSEDGGVQWVQAHFSDHGASGDDRMIVDTGANKTYVSQPLAEQLGLKAIGQQQAHSLFGSGTVGIVRVGEVHLGQLTLLDFPVSLPAKEVLTKASNNSSLLGLDVLSGYRVLMDFPAGKMYLQPNPATVPAIRIGPAPAPPPTQPPAPAAP